MSIKLSKELIAPCGMDCGVCKRYLATIRGTHKDKGLPACAGCCPQNRQCAFIKKSCAQLREKEISFCYECAGFPCRRLKTLDARYTSKYHTSLIANLREIQQMGLEAWLAEEEKKWRCTECGGTVSIHDAICYDCGHRRNLQA